MEFFIALFGIVFYGFKFLKDRSSTRQAIAREKASDVYYNKVHDIPTENKLRWSFFHDMFGALDELSDNLTNIFGPNWQTVFRNTPCYEGTIGHAQRSTLGFRDVWNIAYDLYFAKHGIAAERSYNTNIKIRGVDEPEYSADASRAVGIAVCREIERNIQQCHGERGFRLYKDPVKPHLLTWEYVIDSYGGDKTERMW